MSKAAKHRACPAVGRDISSAECGANRISRYACPASCPYLPFAPANYSQLLDLEGKLDNSSMDYFLNHTPDRAIMERTIQNLRYAANPHALHAFYEWNLFFARDADGRTCAERWEQSPASGLKNDELVMLRAKRQKRVALVEIQRVLDGERIDAVDLLAPEMPVLRLHDRSLASMATRFATGLVWIYPLPHYWRLSGTAILIPELAQFDPREIVTEIVSHLGGPVLEPALRVWLAENFVRFDHALMAVSRARRMQMFAGMDAKAGKALYELQAPFAQCRARLDEIMAVEADRLSPEEQEEGFAEARLWFADATDLKATVPQGGRVALGRVLLGQAHWRLEAFGGERLRQLRQQFEDQLGARARFTGERVDDLAAGLAAKEPAFDQTLVPPRLLEDPQHISISSSVLPAPAAEVSREQTEAEFFHAANRQFLDDKIPALDHHTPREAAKDPALRPRLIRLLKQRVHQQDERNLQTGGREDINWLLRELGTDEILFAPPPWRPPTRVETPGYSEEDDLFNDVLLPPLADLPPAPAIPGPLSAEETMRRLDDIMARYKTPDEAYDALYDCGVTIADDAFEILLDWVSEKEHPLAMNFVLPTVLVMVPPGHRAPPTDFDSLEQRFLKNLQALQKIGNASTPKVFEKFLADSAQRHVLAILVSQIAETVANAPENLSISLEAQAAVIVMIKSVLEELDQALRSGGEFLDV